MKKSLLQSLFLFLFAVVFVPSVSADVIPGNSHPLDRCVRVVNLNDFPDVALIGYYTGPMVDDYEIYPIENNQCLTKGYKFNTLRVYWNTKENATDIDSNKLLLEDIESFGGYVDNKNPLFKEHIEYSLSGANDQFVLYKSKQISEYNDGTPTKVQTFDNTGEIVDTIELPENDPEEPLPLEPTPTSSWQNFLCFFKRMFGGSCY